MVSPEPMQIQLSTIIKKITSWAAIMTVPTAVTGRYRENVPDPGFSQKLGILELDERDARHPRRCLHGIQEARLAVTATRCDAQLPVLP
jgi:hypothetical protein